MIEYVCRQESRIWYVVFDPRRTEFHFWHLFTRRKFDHVWAATPVPGGMLVVKPTPADCLLEVWPIGEVEFIQCLPKDVSAVIRYKAEYSAFKPYIPRGIINCVVVVKYLLGLKGFSLTPYGLYRQLKEVKDGK